MRHVSRFAVVAMVVATAAFSSAAKAVGEEPGDHAGEVRVSKRLAVEVTVPVCVRSGSEEVAVPVTFRNTADRPLLVVWEEARSIRVWPKGILVRPGGWASQPKQWVSLQPGESAKREVVLTFGDDMPALDEGNYTLSLDFAVRESEEAPSMHEQLEVVIHALKAPEGLSLAQVIESGRTYFGKTPRKDPVSTETWELTPNMYPQEWEIRFRGGSGPTAAVRVNKKTGEPSEPIAIP